MLQQLSSALSPVAKWHIGVVLGVEVGEANPENGVGRNGKSGECGALVGGNVG